MTRGKLICGVLKDIRRKIAEANGIELNTSECQFTGECRGTCPKCESEIHYLEEELCARRKMGKAVAIAGISASLFALPSCSGSNQNTSAETNDIPLEKIELTDTIIAPTDTISESAEPTDTCPEPKQFNRITDLLIVGEVEESDMTTTDLEPVAEVESITVTDSVPETEEEQTAATDSVPETEAPVEM